MEHNLPSNFRLAKVAAKNSSMNPQVGCVIVHGKDYRVGYNKPKTHTKYANPEIHERKSIHAELDCFNKAPLMEAEELYVYRELEGVPAMARPCNHCMAFIRKTGIKKIFYTIPHEPYWEVEEL